MDPGQFNWSESNLTISDTNGIFVINGILIAGKGGHACPLVATGYYARCNKGEEFLRLPTS